MGVKRRPPLDDHPLQERLSHKRRASEEHNPRTSNAKEPDHLEKLSPINESAQTLPLSLDIHEPPLTHGLDDGEKNKTRRPSHKRRPSKEHTPHPSNGKEPDHLENLSPINESAQTLPLRLDIHEPPFTHGLDDGEKNKTRRPSRKRRPSKEHTPHPSNGKEPDHLENLTPIDESAPTLPLRLDIHEPPFADWLDDGEKRKTLADSKRIAL